LTLALVKHAHVCVQKTIQTDRQIDIKTDRHIAKVYRPRDRQTDSCEGNYEFFKIYV